jgi:hypothetical protein
MRIWIAVLLLAWRSGFADPHRCASGTDVELSAWQEVGIEHGAASGATLARIAFDHYHEFCRDDGDPGIELRLGLAYQLGVLYGDTHGVGDGLLAEAELDVPLSDSDWRIGPWIASVGLVDASAGVRFRYGNLMLGADVESGFPGDGTRLELGIGVSSRGGNRVFTGVALVGALVATVVAIALVGEVAGAGR